MLDFESSDSDSEKQTRTTQVRHGDNLGDLIARAASALAVDKSVFLRAAIAKEAKRVLEAGSRHTLTPEDAALFAAALDAPPAPTPRALAAAKAYKRRVVHAD
ncbi:DUF1778 domain-containing protein [uncultured Nisaea sp.]|uniref:type II toxin -antitoxin system TacA 1-like antitoxin n=1 Tax=uncultured Nisaea sp. TaxID=538215 RepID=UPI0030ED282A|tara:strand:+ start:2539 stop:2847 length:309 start_codon:yes stop_codon:yes gene_type:complete